MTITVSGFLFPGNYRVWKICSTLRLIDESYDVKAIALGGEHTTEDYKNRCHPMGRTPILKHNDVTLFESAAILRHIARIGATKSDSTASVLYGKNMIESTQVDMWLDYVSNEIDPPSHHFIDVAFKLPMLEGAEEKAYLQLERSIGGLDRHLSIRTYLVGERMTIADIHCAFSLYTFFSLSPKSEEYAKKYKHVFRLFNTILNQKFVVETLQFHEAAIGLPKKEVVTKKKEDKPKKTVPQLEVEEAPKKAANPLDSLPPSKFVLDAFKREYSNKDTRTEAIPYLFDNYDNEGYTMYWCDYLYPEDLSKMLFMTCNLVGGWMQRMDHLRKYGFASVLIAGEENKQQISSFWIFRGKGWPACLDDVVDTELYKWTEITDINAEKDRICDYLAWDGVTFTDTFKLLNGRIYK